MIGSGKREMERFSLNVPAVITLKGNNHSGFGISTILKTKNVCAGGVLVTTEEPLQVGSEVDVELHLAFFTGNLEHERRSNIRVSGSVIRTEPRGMVIKFEEKYQITPVPNSEKIRA